MATLTILVDGTVPVAADFNDNFSALNTEARAATVGGTGFSSFTAGDLLYASSTTALTKLAIGAQAHHVLAVSGTSSTLPEWVSLQTSDLSGLRLSNAADADHDITIAVGRCWSDDATPTTRHFITTSGLTKRIDAVWAVGTAQGGLDTGTVANDTWYHVWLIRRPDTGVTDALFSTSATAPTLPADYTKQRRLGAVLTDGSANIIGFTQVGDHFLWTDPPLDLDDSTVTTARTTATLSVPPGFKHQAVLNVMITNAGAVEVYISSAATDEAPSVSAAPLGQLRCTAGGTTLGQITTQTSTTSTVFVRSTAASTTVRIATLGWFDRRGRDD